MIYLSLSAGVETISKIIQYVVVGLLAILDDYGVMTEITKQKTFLPAVKMAVSVFADKKKPLSDMLLPYEYITKH